MIDVSELIDARDMLDTLGRPASYRSGRGRPVELTVLGPSKRQVEISGQLTGEYAEIRVAVEDLAEPSEGDVVTLDGETWTVGPGPYDQISMRRVGGFHVLRVLRGQRPSGGGRG